MNDVCGTMRSMLPDRRHGTLTPEQGARLDAHVKECVQCAMEAEFLETLERSRPEPPAQLLGDIERALDAELSADTSLPLRRRAAPWTWSAAAALVMALGTGLIWQQLRTSPDPMVAESMEPVPDSWLTDDAMVAGALVLDDLSDEDLSALLEEVGG